MLQSVGEPLAFLHRHGAVHAGTGTFGIVIHAIRQRPSSATLTGYIGNQPEIFGWSAVAKGWGVLISAAGSGANKAGVCANPPIILENISFWLFLVYD